MTSLLKLEFLKIRRNNNIIGLFIFVFFLGILMTGGQFNDYPMEYRDETGTNISVYDVQQSSFTGKYYNEETFLRYVNRFYGTDFKTVDTFYEFLDGDLVRFDLFPKIMNTSTATFIASFLLASFYLFVDFKKRGLTSAFSLGRSRSAVLVSKTIAYYIMVIAAELIVTLVTLVFYARTWASVVGGGYILRCLAIKMLLVAGSASVPLFVVYLLKRPAAAGFINLAYAAGLVIINRIFAENSQSGVSIPLPAVIQANLTLWQPDCPASLTAQAVIWPLVYIAFFLALSLLCFRRYETV